MTHKISQLLILTTITTLLAGQAGADIYKCATPSGKVLFQDRPCVQPNRQIDTIKQIIKPVASGNQDEAKKNIIKNHTFDESLENWNVSSDEVAWHSSLDTGNSGTVMLHAAHPKEGVFSQSTFAKQCIPIGESSTFRFGGRFLQKSMPSETKANQMRIVWYEEADCSKGGQFGNYIEPQNIEGWQDLTSSDISPALLAKAASVQIMQDGRYSNDSTAYWDDLFLVADESINKTSDKSIETLPPGQNHIINGDFTFDVSSWNSQWNPVWIEQEGYNQIGSIGVTATSVLSKSIGKTAFEQCVNFGKNKLFDAGVNFKKDKTSTQDGAGRFRVAWYENVDCKGRTKIGRTATTSKANGWIPLTLKDLEAPPNTSSVKIEAIQTIDGKGKFSAFWDDVYFKARYPE